MRRLLKALINLWALPNSVQIASDDLKLTFASGKDRQKVIRGLPVFDCELGKIVQFMEPARNEF